jgi:hypothetical protein
MKRERNQMKSMLILWSCWSRSSTHRLIL